MADGPKEDADEFVEGQTGDTTAAPQGGPLSNLARRIRRAVRGQGAVKGLDGRREGRQSTARETTSESDPLEDPDECAGQSTTKLIECYANGDGDALASLMERHNRRLLLIASRYFRCLQMYDPAYDADDAVNLAWAKVCQMIETGRMTTVRDSVEFWKVYTMILYQEILRHNRRYRALRRGADRHRAEWGPQRRLGASGGETASVKGYEHGDNPVDAAHDRLPPPEDLVLAQLELEALQVALDDPILRTILDMRIDGFTIAEIADRLDFSMRSIDRKLRSIREQYLRLSGERTMYG